MYKNKQNIILFAFLFLVMLAFGYIIKTALNSNEKVHASEASSTSIVSEAQISDNSNFIEENANTPQILLDQNTPKKPEIVKYIVKQGDTLESIAKAYNISANSIVESSGISKEDLLKEGQELIFPSITGVVHKVKDGDTLWDISSVYKMEIDKIVSINDMKSPDALKIGQQLIIPDADKVKLIENQNDMSGIKVASRSGSSVSAKPSIIGMWPVSGSVTSWFGSRWGGFHKGIDIGASTGTAVYAFSGGKVVFSGWDSGGYGYLVIINHGNGIETYYGHNSKLFVSAGQEIQSGDRIASVGSTGDSTGPHCHFEVRRNGTPVNPVNYLK